MYLYLMTNSVNSKQYVGVTTQKLTRRRNAHFNFALRGGDTVLMRAIRKHGTEAFTMEQIGEASTWENLMQLEREAIASYHTLVPHGYNMTQGGEGLLGLAHTPQAREAIGVARRGKPRDATTRAKLSLATKSYLAEHGNPMQGRSQSPETRAKIAARAVGRQGYWLGKKMGPLSEEHRQKLSDAHKGKVTWNKGVPHTAETRAKMTASRTGGKNWKARAIELNSVMYPSIMDAVRATGLSHMQVRYRLQTGRAQYLDQEITTSKQSGLRRELSPERRAYLSSLRQGQKHTDATKAKIAASKLGKPRSEETRAKVATGIKAYYTDHANPMQGRAQSADAKALISARARARGDSIQYEGIVYPSMADAAESTGLSRTQLMYRLKQGTAIRIKKE